MGEASPLDRKHCYGDPVARPAAMRVLKLVAGRDQDLSDLFAIVREPFVISEVREELRNVMNPSLGAKLAQIPDRLRASKIFSDALSTRAMGQRDSLENVRLWANFKATVDSVLPKRRSEVPNASVQRLKDSLPGIRKPSPMIRLGGFSSDSGLRT